ncbi:hypothetical protein AAG570_004765 [Ranatra chinensis]|uniref:Major facilitator superfamily (MFS) profile domain-containing protein n=1 Tax=Ranatra chinensis TaxID=642074 RepID=A0ABD0YJY8_9HEMI
MGDNGSYVVFAASLAGVVSGCAFVWLTPLLPQLKSENSEVPMTEAELSWVVSIIEIGDIFTPVPSALLADRLGRKPVLLASGPFQLAAWLIILLSRSVAGLCIARFIQGLAMGIMYAVLPIYLAEIASPAVRGSVGIFVQYSWYFGLIFEYSIGPFLTYSQIIWASMPLTIVSISEITMRFLV